MPSLGKAVGKKLRSTDIGKQLGRNKHGKIVIQIGQDFIDSKARQVSYTAVNRFMKLYRDTTSKHSVRPGLNIGTVDNSDQSYICGSSNELSFKHTVNSANLSAEANTKIYTDFFNVGRPTSGSLYSFSKNKLIDKKSLVDTERDYLSSSNRASLTINNGFNQKAFNFLLSDTFMSVGDFKFLFKAHETKFVDPLATKNIYGNIFYEHLNLRIKSETDYYTTRVRLHLVKIKNPSISVSELVQNTFVNKNKLADKPAPPYSVPLDRQISIQPTSFGKFRSEILTDLKCSLTSSVYFKDSATIVKTFKRNLGPNDIWNFNYYLHYGPGLFLNRLFETGQEKNYRFPYGHDSHPCGYFFIIETKGDPRSSITRTSDGSNFDGSSPSRIDVSFNKQLKFVRDPDNINEVMTTREFISNDEDFVDDTLSNYFSPNRQNKINVGVTKINLNRVVDSSLPYQVRYGESRLAVYLDPEAAKLFDKLKDPTPAPGVGTAAPGWQLDPNYTPGQQPSQSDPEGSNLRGVNVGTNDDPDSSDYVDMDEQE